MAAVLVRRLASRRTERAIAIRPLTSTAAAAASSPNEKDGGSSSSSSSKNNDNHRTHLLFGANTDVGKSIVSTGLVRAAVADVRASSSSSPLSVNYIKPLQCGGSDESFVLRHRDGDLGGGVKCRTLFSWDTPASPHLVSRWEDRPVSDDEVLDSLRSSLDDIRRDGGYTIIETAGGAMSPSSSSPRNRNDGNDGGFWGWSTQADLYAPLGVPAVFVGDGRLGGISVTLSTLESLRSRGYRIDAVVFIEGSSSDAAGVVDGAGDDGGIQFGRGNTDALREYIAMYGEDWGVSVPGDDSIVCLPPLPPMPMPLDDWYDNNRGAFLKLHRSLCKRWNNNK